MAQLNELGKKVEEANLTLGDFEKSKRKGGDKKASYKRLIQSNREQQLKVLYNLVTVFPFLLHPLFNEN